MKNTESHFGLEKVGNRVSADNGETLLPRYADMTDDEFHELLADVEYWMEERMTAEDIADLKEILE